MWSSGSLSSSLLTSSPQIFTISRTRKICGKRTRFTDESTNLVNAKFAGTGSIASVAPASRVPQSKIRKHIMLVRSAGSTSFLFADFELSLHRFLPVLSCPLCDSQPQTHCRSSGLGCARVLASFKERQYCVLVYFCNAFELSLQTNIESDFRELALHQFRKTSCTRPGG